MKNYLLLVALTLLVIFSGCKKDDPETECASTAIVGITESEPGYLDEVGTFTFDGQNRVIKGDWKYGTDTWTTTYTYQTDKITRTNVEGANTRSGVYTISNGNISKYTSGNVTIEFSYNAENYLSKTVVKFSGVTDVTNELMYSNGNLTQAIEKHSSGSTTTYKYTYSTSPANNLLGFGNSLMLVDDILEEAGDYFLVSSGLFGKSSINEPTGYIVNQNTIPVTFNKDANGKITSMVKDDTVLKFTFDCN